MMIDFGRWALSILQLSVGITFMVSFLSKAGDPGALRLNIARYRILPASVTGLAAYALLFGESIVAFCLVTGIAVPVGLALGASLLLAFLFGVLKNLHVDQPPPCGCFGSREETISGVTVARILLLLLSVGVLIISFPSMTAEPITLMTRHSIWDLLLATVSAIGLVIIAALLLRISNMSRTLRSPSSIGINSTTRVVRR